MLIAMDMNRTLLYSFILISISLMAILGTHTQRSLRPHFRAERVIKLKSFEAAREKISKEELEILKLWESILTGRSAPLSKMIKEHYQSLGLNHIFTPSGFHLSAVLFPFMKILPKVSYQFYFLLAVGLAVSFLPGLLALKRMVIIKSTQKLLGMKTGFIGGLILDMLFGSFQSGALSFTYSLLFLSIIYSGAKGIGLILWFFIGQLIVAYYQGNDISPLILVFSPLINLAFTFAMPLLFLLAFPLWDWQLRIGIYILGGIQKFVIGFSDLSSSLPLIEVHAFLLLLVFFVVIRRFKIILFGILVFSNSLNSDHARFPSMPSKEFVPAGKVLETIYREKDVVVKFQDGKCRMKLVQGIWWENCSPIRGSR